MNRTEFDNLSHIIINAAIDVHRELGPGLLELVYAACLAKELGNRGIYFETQIKLPIVYKGEKLKKEFYLDMLVENEIIVELKSVEVILPVHEVQLLTYLKLADKRLGLLINFNVPVLIKGVKRKVNKLPE